jgi:EAL domain-containing protein (putative c-di-GMP-specific phosphodiesterase class I)
VDHADQAARLAAFGCQHAQGYLFGAPAPAAAITSRLGADPHLTLVA